MSGCSCEHYTHPGDCDYCKGFEHGKEKGQKEILAKVKDILYRKFGKDWPIVKEIEKEIEGLT